MSMWVLVLVGVGLFLAVNSSSKRHYQDWREQQPANVEHKIYPGTFDLGEVVGVLVLAIIILVIVSML